VQVIRQFVGDKIIIHQKVNFFITVMITKINHMCLNYVVNSNSLFMPFHYNHYNSHLCYDDSHLCHVMNDHDFKRSCGHGHRIL
jgi:hypothetical protein